jgi:Dolichyl-phosphate-mannose-protein mannosyltransferase
MRDGSGAAGLDLGLPEPGAVSQPARPWPVWARWLEALGVALSPAAAALVLRLRLMAPSDLPDPALHTSYIVEARDVFMRYSWLAGEGRLREGGRVGFLVPARLAYLAFGAVPGFFVTRYVFALIAVGPVYLLLRRLYSPAAGVAGIVVVLSSPVIVTAWGTDYPDSAVVSYALGAMACLVMPCSPRWRRAWLAAAGVLITLAVWSHMVAVPLVGAALAAWLGVRLVRERAGLPGDLAVLAGVAAAVTGLLVLASAVVLGHANFFALTWEGYRLLSQPSLTAQNHSAHWQWAPYVAYLLAPPAVVGAFAVAVIRRGHAVRTPVLMVGVMAATQVAAYALLQFAGSVQVLEQHYFSSTLWAGVCLAFAVTLAELARPLWDRPLARWLPAAVLVAVPLAYEAAPHVPAFGWLPFGAIVAAAVIIAAAVARACARIGQRAVAAAATALALVVFAGAALVLTVAPIPHHRPLPDTATKHDPAPAYASALGGSATTYIDSYRIITALPGFVGRAAYPGEQILMWRIAPRGYQYVRYAAGMYHDGPNSLGSHSAQLPGKDRQRIRGRRPAEMLLLGGSAAPFPAAVRKLAAFRPTLVHAGELRAGPLVMRVWLVRLGAYYHSAIAPH